MTVRLQVFQEVFAHYSERKAAAASSETTRRTVYNDFQKQLRTIPKVESQAIQRLSYILSPGPLPAAQLLLTDGDAADDCVVFGPLAHPAWELLEVAEPAPAVKSRSWAQNAGPIDLAFLGAMALETVCTSHKSSDDQPQDCSGIGQLGKQSNFDSEVPATREPVWARDFRRSLRCPARFGAASDPDTLNGAEVIDVDDDGQDIPMEEAVHPSANLKRKAPGDAIETEPLPSPTSHRRLRLLRSQT